MSRLHVAIACALRRRCWSERRIASELGYSRSGIRYRLQADAEDKEGETEPLRRYFAGGNGKKKTMRRLLWACTVVANAPIDAFDRLLADPTLSAEERAMVIAEIEARRGAP